MTAPRGLRGALITSLLGLAALSPATLHGNGGELRVANVTMGAYRVSVFTDPTPVRPGELHVSVLVTRPGQDGVAEGVSVLVSARSVETGAVRSERATRAAAADLRYYATHVELGEEGRWEIQVTIEGDDGAGSASFLVNAREAGIFGHPAALAILALLPLAALSVWILRKTPASRAHG